MKKITQEFIDDSKPFDYDIEKLKKLNLLDNNGNINDEYINIVSTYRLLLENMLVQELHLKNYDDILKNSELGYNKVQDDDMDVYQYYSNTGLDYIYLRNNIYIENFSVEERQFLLNKYNNNNFELDEQTLNFINQTYVNAIRNPNSSPYLATKVCYHISMNPRCFVDSTKLVLGVRYDEFHNDGLDDDKWDDLYIKRESLLADLISKMNKDLNNKNIEVLRYGAYSVLNRKKKDNIKTK